MCFGSTTIAGSVLVAYMDMGANPQALIYPAMSCRSRLLWWSARFGIRKKSSRSRLALVPADDENKPAKNLDAFAKGACLRLKIAGITVATLLCIIAFIALINGLLTRFGHYITLAGEYDLTTELILGYLLHPIAFLLGVTRGPDLLRLA